MANDVNVGGIRTVMGAEVDAEVRYEAARADYYHVSICDGVYVRMLVLMLMLVQVRGNDMKLG
jgi:pentose-5-phosphate-3-epimerase